MPRTIWRVVASIATSASLVVACSPTTVLPSASEAARTAAAPSVAMTAMPPSPPEPNASASPSQVAVGPGSWTLTGSMIQGRSFGSTAAVLQDGRVLVAGGEGEDSLATAAAELYDPMTGRWVSTGRLHSRRRGDAAALLADGRVIVIGGFHSPPRVGELYDPQTGTWSTTRPMASQRYAVSLAPLPDDRVLVFGGWAPNGTWNRRVDLFDATTESWRSSAQMAAPPGPVAVLADGRLLVMHEGHAPEIFDPATKRWGRIASPLPLTSGQWVSAIRLADGRVLLMSSHRGAAEIYDPITDTWSATNDPHTGLGPATLLDDGTVLVVGSVRSARFDPATGSWSDVPRPPLPRDYALESVDGVEVDLMARLRDGRVLVTEHGSVAVYDPMAGG